MHNRPAASYLYSCSLCNSLGVAVCADDLFPIIITSCALVGEAIFFHPSQPHPWHHPRPSDDLRLRTGLHDNNNILYMYHVYVTDFPPSPVPWYSAIYYTYVLRIHRLIGHINLFSVSPWPNHRYCLFLYGIYLQPSGIAIIY